MAQIIRDCTNFQLVDSCLHKSHNLLNTIESDTPFDMLFIYFYKPVYILYRYGPSKILTFLDCMAVFRISESSGIEVIISEQVAQWDFVNFFVPFWISNIIFVDADKPFIGHSRRISRRPY